MPLFRSSSESSHPPKNGESLSEAFLDTSSVRDTLPDQYRAHFDELRSGILAFCHEFDIPVETLKSKEAFGAELASKRIPPEHMAQAVFLFQRLEHLITNKEPFREKISEALEYTDRLYNLKEQYAAQAELLERVGILKEGAIIGIDGNKYPIPNLEQIAQRLYERREELKTKRDQGFTKLLLVPFGMSLDTLCETFKQFLLFYQQTHPAFVLNTNNFLYTWGGGFKGVDTKNPPKIVYNPQSFDSNHQSQTKTQILEEQTDNQDSSSFPGWKVHLFQPFDPAGQESKGFVSIPRQGQGKTQGKENPRPDLEANKTPEDYLFFLQQAQNDPDSPYFQEFGLTPEDWILAFMTHLNETGEPLDNYQNNTDNIAYLTGVFSPSSVYVSYACWERASRQACLDWRGPDNQEEYFGVRTSVII